MRAPTARGCAGAALAVGVLSAVLLAPRPTAEPMPPAGSEALQGNDCAPAAGCPAADEDEKTWVRAVRRQLARRIPGLSERERVGLAAAIAEESAVAGLDPLLVLAMIEVESGFDVDARSPRGARGLMQLRLATFAHETERSRLGGGVPEDPVLNVRAGVRYYRRLLAAFRRHELALMAYNAGPTRIRGYLRKGGIPERFRGYPRRVLAEARRLRTALAERPAVAAREGAARVQ